MDKNEIESISQCSEDMSQSCFELETKTDRSGFEMKDSEECEKQFESTCVSRQFEDTTESNSSASANDVKRDRFASFEILSNPEVIRMLCESPFEYQDFNSSDNNASSSDNLTDEENFPETEVSDIKIFCEVSSNVNIPECKETCKNKVVGSFADVPDSDKTLSPEMNLTCSTESTEIGIEKPIKTLITAKIGDSSRTDVDTFFKDLERSFSDNDIEDESSDSDKNNDPTVLDEVEYLSGNNESSCEQQSSKTTKTDDSSDDYVDTLYEEMIQLNLDVKIHDDSEDSDTPVNSDDTDTPINSGESNSSEGSAPASPMSTDCKPDEENTETLQCSNPGIRKSSSPKSKGKTFSESRLSRSRSRSYSPYTVSPKSGSISSSPGDVPSNPSSPSSRSPSPNNRSSSSISSKSSRRRRKLLSRDCRSSRSSSSDSNRSASSDSDRSTSPDSDSSERSSSPNSDKSTSSASDGSDSDRSTSPDIDGSDSNSSSSSDSDRTTTPESDKSASPDSERSASPESDRSDSPDSKRSSSPVSERSSSPVSERSSSPESERSPSSDSDKPSSPDSDDSSSSDSDRSNSPDSERSDSPDSERPVDEGSDRPTSPFSDRSASPHGDQSIIPGSDKYGSHRSTSRNSDSSARSRNKKLMRSKLANSASNSCIESPGSSTSTNSSSSPSSNRSGSTDSNLSKRSSSSNTESPGKSDAESSGSSLFGSPFGSSSGSSSSRVSGSSSSNVSGSPDKSATESFGSDNFSSPCDSDFGSLSPENLETLGFYFKNGDKINKIEICRPQISENNIFANKTKFKDINNFEKINATLDILENIGKDLDKVNTVISFNGVPIMHFPEAASVSETKEVPENVQEKSVLKLENVLNQEFNDDQLNCEIVKDDFYNENYQNDTTSDSSNDGYESDSESSDDDQSFLNEEIYSKIGNILFDDKDISNPAENQLLSLIATDRNLPCNQVEKQQLNKGDLSYSITDKLSIYGEQNSMRNRVSASDLLTTHQKDLLKYVKEMCDSLMVSFQGCLHNLIPNKSKESNEALTMKTNQNKPDSRDVLIAASIENNENDTSSSLKNITNFNTLFQHLSAAAGTDITSDQVRQGINSELVLELYNGFYELRTAEYKNLEEIEDDIMENLNTLQRIAVRSYYICGKLSVILPNRGQTFEELVSLNKELKSVACDISDHMEAIDEALMNLKASTKYYMRYKTCVSDDLAEFLFGDFPDIFN